MIMLSAKIPELPGQKSHAYISEKVGRYMLMFSPTDEKTPYEQGENRMVIILFSR